MAKVPLIPQWNCNNGCVCTPDGGFLYVGARSINFIRSRDNQEESAEIRIFHTRQNILSLDIDPHWGEAVVNQADASDNDKEPKLFVVLAHDNSVQIWDFNKGCALQGHKAHLACVRYMEGNGPSPQQTFEVFISYMINRNVLSIDNQDIVIYCVASNSFYRRPMFISPRKHQISAVKCSPFNENHFAVGTKRGMVLLCDLQSMVILFTLRGHDTSCITSLAWNRFELEGEAEKEVKTQKLTRSDSKMVDTDDIFDIYDYDYLDNEFGAAPQESKTELDSEFVGFENPIESSGAAQFDFAEACQSLKEEINALREEQTETLPENVVSLEDCRNAEAHDTSSSCNSERGDDDKMHSEKLSSDGSLVRLVCGTPSSEESVDLDGMNRVICQAEVHSALAAEVKAATLITDSASNHTLFKAADEISSKHTLFKAADEIAPKLGADVLTSSSSMSSDILLASASNDGTVCIFNTVTGGTCDHKKIRSLHHKNFRPNIIWLDKSSFVVSNLNGCLQMWKLHNANDKETGNTCQNRRYKFKETKRTWLQRNVVAFSISSETKFLWCITLNREICLEDIKENKMILQYGCVTTNISALRECPENMNKIAIGLSDRRIGLIDISKMTPKLIQIVSYGHRIDSSVSTLVWSPDSKKIAFGTVEGRIGIVSLQDSVKSQPRIFNSMCGKKVYSMCWQDNYVYVACNDRIAVYEDIPKNEDGILLNRITGVSAISVRDKYLFVGTTRGKLQMYEHNENSRHKIDYHLKVELDLTSRYITELSWSPIATNVLAVVSSSNKLHILDFKPETGDLSIRRNIVIKSAKAANTCVKWSNRNENNLMTCGSDGAIRVWDLSQESDCERFVKLYHCPMTCGLFLPTDEEILLCAGKSTSLEFIDMRTEKLQIQETKIKRFNASTIDNVQWATKAATRSDESKKPNSRGGNKKIANNLIENHLPSNSSQSIENICENGEDVTQMLGKLNIQKPEKPCEPSTSSIYMRSPQTMLFLTTKEINKDALNVMYNIMEDTITHVSSEKKSLCSKLFGSKLEANNLLAEELKNHQTSETKGISSIIMPQLNATLKEEILKCIQTKQLCEWHVSVAPSISYGFWQKCCQAYAEQLVEQDYVLQAAVYYISIHKECEAINVLVKRTYFKEAMLIARIYLQKDDPLFDALTEGWITYLYNNGNLTGAALLCLLSKQNDRAYECLAKIRNSHPDIERCIRLLKKL